MSGGDGPKEEESAGLGLRDYLALFIAAVETLGLPMIVFIVVVLAALVVAKLIR